MYTVYHTHTKSVHVYMYIHTRLQHRMLHNVHAHVPIRMYAHTYAHTHTHMRACAHMHAHTHAHTHTHTHLYSNNVCMYISACNRTSKRTFSLASVRCCDNKTFTVFTCILLANSITAPYLPLTTCIYMYMLSAYDTTTPATCSYHMQLNLSRGNGWGNGWGYVRIPKEWVWEENVPPLVHL